MESLISFFTERGYYIPEKIAEKLISVMNLIKAIVKGGGLVTIKQTIPENIPHKLRLNLETYLSIPMITLPEYYLKLIISSAFFGNFKINYKVKPIFGEVVYTGKVTFSYDELALLIYFILSLPILYYDEFKFFEKATSKTPTKFPEINNRLFEIQNLIKESR